MMLPEHKEAIICQQHEEGCKLRPTLDSQECELIESALAESFYEHRTVTLRLYDEYEDIELKGIVITAQTFRREIKWEWICIENILSASTWKTKRISAPPPPNS